jgi:hypothetical protein
MTAQGVILGRFLLPKLQMKNVGFIWEVKTEKARILSAC